jgi:hypothetical protein
VPAKDIFDYENSASIRMQTDIAKGSRTTAPGFTVCRRDRSDQRNRLIASLPAIFIGKERCPYANRTRICRKPPGFGRKNTASKWAGRANLAV